MRIQRSQSSVEFLVLAGFMFMFFIGLAAVIGGKMIEYQAARSQKQVQDIMDVVKSEIQLAGTSLDGYERTFPLPLTINGREYEMGLYVDPSGDNFFVVIFEGNRYETSFAGTIMQGTSVYKGNNFITKYNGEIFIDSKDPCKEPEIDAGLKSYCVGLTCYCLSGNYDSQCNDNEDANNDGFKDDDKIFEDDFIVQHCGNASKTEDVNGDGAPDPWVPIDCVADDPCNLPPQFSVPPFVVLDADLNLLVGERNATIGFTANEQVTAVVSYNYFDPLQESCDSGLVLDNYSARFGPFSGQVQVRVEGLVPEKTYCFMVTIQDKKGKEAVSEPGETFMTHVDTTPPILNSIAITPQKGYLYTAFAITADIDEPSGMSISRIYINRTGKSQISQYELNDQGLGLDALANNGIYTANFTVENDFYDPNASFEYDELTTLLFNKFDDPYTLDADYSAGDPAAYTESSLPDPVGGRFTGAIYATSGRTLRYKTAGNFNPSQGTIQFWANSSWDGDAPGTFFFFDEGTSANRMYIAKLGAYLYFFIRHSDTPYYVRLPLNSWDKHEWHLVTAVWNLPAGVMNLYVDASNNGLTDSGGTIGSLAQTSPEFAVGYDQLYAAEDYYYAEAIMDQFIISNEPKTQAQIQADMATEWEYYADVVLEDARGNSQYYPQKAAFRINYTEPP